MNVLGIETSCDETAVAVVKNGKTVLSNTVSSSLKEHVKYGGVIPEIASRRQLEYIYTTAEESLKSANLQLSKIDKIAVTTTPGLIGSLLVGISFAKSLSASLKIPLTEVNHIQAHLYANFIHFKDKKFTKPKLPAIGLIVSGGHTSLYYMKDETHFQEIGRTLDDAAGEAFDKVARVLELGYPGGPIIDKRAKLGENQSIKFTCASLPGTYNFSFSGIKTAVLYYKQKHEKLSSQDIDRVCYSFQKSVVDTLVEKSLSACREFDVRTILVGGGVAANSSLREKLISAGQKQGVCVHFPEFAFCLDNAAMIAGLGFHQN